MTAKRKKTDVKDFLAQVPVSDKTRSGMTLTIDDLQYLLRLHEMRDEAIREEIHEYLDGYFKRDNEELAKSIVNNVTEQVAETISPIWNILEQLGKGQLKIQKSIDELTEKVHDHEKRIKILEGKVL